jgi:hypothetical protein
VNLVVINAHENHAVLAQELTRQEQARIHHRKPRGAIASTRFRIACYLLRQLEVRLERVGVIVGIDKIVAGVVGRVNVNHLDAPKVRLVEEFQNFEVVAFDEQVLCVGDVHAFAWRGDERRAAWRLQEADRVALARPRERITFRTFVHHIAQRGAQFFKIHFVFAERLWKNLAQLFNLLAKQIGRLFGHRFAG